MLGSTGCGAGRWAPEPTGYVGSSFPGGVAAGLILIVVVTTTWNWLTVKTGSVRPRLQGFAGEGSGTMALMWASRRLGLLLLAVLLSPAPRTPSRSRLRTRGSSSRPDSPP